MTDRHRVAILGCGRIAWAHAYGWSRDERVEVVALADPDERARDGLADALGVAAEGRFGDYASLLAATDVDIVSICLWTGAHRDAVEVSLERGARAVLCEKPLAPTLHDAQAVVKAAARRDVLLAVGHQRRFYPAWQRLREMVASGDLGEPLRGWSTTGGALLNNGTHTLDLLDHVLVDRPLERVLGTAQRNTDRYERGVRAEELALAWFGFGGGFTAVLECNLGPDSPFATGASLLFSEADVRIVESSVLVRRAGAAEWLPLDEQRPVADTPLGVTTRSTVQGVLPDAALAPFAEAFVSQASAIVDCLEAGSTAGYPSTGETAYRAVEAITAVFVSMAERSMVELPLTPLREHPLDLMVGNGILPHPAGGPYDIRDPAGSHQG